MEPILYNGLSYYLRNDKLPEGLSEQVKTSILTRKNDYFVQDGLLFFHQNRREEPLLVIKLQDVRQVLTEGHGGISGGHFNYETTYKKLRRNFYWPDMSKQINEFVSTCSACQRATKPKRSNPLRPIEVSKPMELIGIDLVGPLELTTSGNRYIVVVTEYLTKWVEAQAIPDKKGSTIAKYLFREIYARYGTPERMISDQGTEFLNETVEALNKIMRVNGIHTTPYRPQTNGLTERTNQTLCNAIYRCSLEKDDEWDEWLHTVLYAYRDKEHSSTKFTPSFLMHGFQMNTPLVIEKRKGLSDEDKIVVTARQYGELIGERLTDARKTALENKKKGSERQKRNYDKKIKETKYKIGQYVLYWRTDLEQTHGNKFKDKYRGPYIIHEVYDNGTYKLRETDGRILKKPINGDKLKEFKRQPGWLPLIPIEKLPKGRELELAQQEVVRQRLRETMRDKQITGKSRTDNEPIIEMKEKAIRITGGRKGLNTPGKQVTMLRKSLK